MTAALKPSHTARFGIAGLAALAIAMAAALAPPVAVAKDKPTGEEELAKLLEGRVAGEPQRCIRRHISDRMQTIDGTAYVYGRGKTIYVQRTKHPEDIDEDDVMVIRKFGSSDLCRLESITTVDRYSGFFTGAVFFEDFVPYTKVDEAETADGA